MEMSKLSARRVLGIALVAGLVLACLSIPSARNASAQIPPAGIALLSLPAGDDDEDKRDPQILRFSTVGDSRQDPVTFDTTTAPLSGQDAIWLQNTKAFTRILDTIHDQKASLLFFNGDMIM